MISGKYLFVLIVALLANSLDARMYFMHIPKTGGTTLRLLLEQQVSAEEIYPFRNTKHAIGPINEWLVSGHFPYWFCKNLDGDFEKAFKVTILREPVERYLSYLRFRKKAAAELHDLESVLRLRQHPNIKYHRGLIDNALCRHLSADPLLEGEALLASAKKTLQTLDCVILFESFTQDVIELFKRLGITLHETEIPRLNTTEKEAISESLLAEVRELNELDIRLYEYARQNLHKKNSEYKLRTQTFDNLVKLTQTVDYTFNLPLQGSGWNYRETLDIKGGSLPICRWVMDRPASIFFSLEEGFDYILTFNAHPITKEVTPQVSVNGHEIELTRSSHRTFSLYQGKIPKSLITNHPTEISFHSSKTFIYRDIYPKKHNPNYPPLSFAVNKITLKSIQTY